MKLRTLVLGLCSSSALAFAAHAESITIATVNNGDMVRMQKLTDDFTKANPDIQLNWVTLEENVLRERVTTDIATKGGQYDVMTIGTYEVPIWAKQSWLLPLDKLGDDYDVKDILPAIAGGLSVDPPDSRVSDGRVSQRRAKVLKCGESSLRDVSSCVDFPMLELSKLRLE